MKIKYDPKINVTSTGDNKMDVSKLVAQELAVVFYKDKEGDAIPINMLPVAMIFNPSRYAEPSDVYSDFKNKKLYAWYQGKVFLVNDPSLKVDNKTNEEQTDVDLTIAEMLEVIAKHHLTLNNYRFVKDQLDIAIGYRTIGSKKA